MGLLKSLAKVGGFGLVGLMMSKKKKKPPVATSPAVSVTAPMPISQPEIGSTDDFRGAFRSRARSLASGDEMDERERRRRMRGQQFDEDD